jgi:myo-inositol catabolism protein IolC
MADELFLLAMDHRDSLERDVYGLVGAPTEHDIAAIEHGKLLVFQGLLEAIATGASVSSAGVLVDERYGAAVARGARQRSIDLAMPIERSGQQIFTLEYGDLVGGEWLDHIAEFDPDQVKVLVRDNPDDDPVQREQQLEDLAIVSWALKEAARSFIIELVVPATPTQLESVGGDALRYDAEVRPELTVRLIAEYYGRRIEPTLWKIEGLESADAAVSVVRAAQSGGRTETRCIILGRDAPADRLDHWLSIAAVTPGFIGFAIGRSIWEQPLRDLLAGGTEATLVTAVAAAYRHFVDVWNAALLPTE